MHDLEQLSLRDAQAWYDQWYHPSNSIIVIAGDVDATQSIHLANHYFGSIPDKAAPITSAPKTIASRGTREITVKAAAQLPALYMGFNTPTLGSTGIGSKDTGSGSAEKPSNTQAYALYTLAALLDGGYSSRLPKQLVRDKKMAANASASYNPFSRGDSLFVITATPTQETTLKTLQTGIWQSINELKSTPPSDEELERVKAQLFAQLIYQQDNLQHQASQLGQMTSLGLNWDSPLKMIEHINALSSQDLMDAAKIFLTADNVTVAQLIPE